MYHVRLAHVLAVRVLQLRQRVLDLLVRVAAVVDVLVRAAARQARREVRRPALVLAQDATLLRLRGRQAVALALDELVPEVCLVAALLFPARDAEVLALEARRLAQLL